MVLGIFIGFVVGIFAMGILAGSSSASAMEREEILRQAIYKVLKWQQSSNYSEYFPTKELKDALEDK